MKRKGIVIALSVVALGLAAFGITRLNRWQTMKERLFRKDEPVKQEFFRGKIYDRDGVVLADNAVVYDLHLDCVANRHDSTMFAQLDAEWMANAKQLAAGLAEIVGERSEAEYLRILRDGRRCQKRYLRLGRNLSEEQMSELRKLPILKESMYTGGRIEEKRLKRVYPYDGLARRTLGYVRYLDDDSIQRIVGLEGNFDEKLKEADMHTTLELGMQQIADSLLRQTFEEHPEVERGCIALMEVRTGALRTVVNLIRSDSYGHPVVEYFNNLIGVSYEPGKVAAPITSGLDTTLLKMSLENRTIGTGRKFDVLGLREIVVPDFKNDPNPEKTMEHIHKGFSVMMTPLHVLNFYNTIANGCVQRPPYLVESFSRDGRLVELVEHDSYDMDEGIENFELNMQVMENTKVPVFYKHGTSRVLHPYTRKYRDEKGNEAYNATCVGYFPADKPQYSFICYVQTVAGNRSFYGSFVRDLAKDLVNSLN